MDDDREYVNFGDVVARGQIGGQCQYVSRYVDGRIEGYPNLGKDLRFKGDTSDYHELMIHQDDVEEFVRRYNEYHNKQTERWTPSGLWGDYSFDQY